MPPDTSPTTPATETSPFSPAKQRLLDAAERLFMERGYAGVTLRDIAGALAIKQASLYQNHRFDTQATETYACLAAMSIMTQLPRKSLYRMVNAGGRTGDPKLDLRA